MSRRFGIVLTDEQAEVLIEYARQRWMKPKDILRHALNRYMANRSFLSGKRLYGRVDEESFGKLTHTKFSELFPTGSEPAPPNGLKEKAERQAFWSLMRARVFERDEYKCRICGSDGDGKLHVHHVIKRREGGPDSAENLITLCPSCHSKYENGFPRDYAIVGAEC